MSKFKGDYPPDWPMIAWCIKTVAGWRCERCTEPDDPSTGHALTVHHLDNDKSNIADWNLAALCQRCHLHIQARVNMAQGWMFDHSDWMQPHVEGFYVERGYTRQRHAYGRALERGSDEGTLIQPTVAKTR